MAHTRSATEGIATIQGAESPAVDHQAWRTEIIRLAPGGVNLTKSLDALDPSEVAILTNGLTMLGGGVETRPGLTPLVFGGGVRHSVFRLNDPRNNTSDLFWGVDATLQQGAVGVTNPIAGGFSGNPLSFVSWQSEYSGEPWVFVADDARMAKASLGSGALPIGLPRAAQPSSVVAAAALITDIAQFSSDDSTDAAAWTPITGTDQDGNAAGAPVIYDSTGISTGAVNMALSEGAAASGYFSGMSIAKAVDLSALPGPVVSDDQDLIHFALRINLPAKISEVRLYFVVGAFTNGAIPGAAATGDNPSAYCRAFRSSDFSQFVAQQGTALSAQSAQRSAQILALQRQAATDVRARVELSLLLANQQREQLTAAAQQQQLANKQAAFTPPTEAGADVVSSASLAGSDVWTQYGSLGLPLRKSDFLKIGQAGQPGFTWAEVSGIVITVITSENVPVTVGFDECWLQGGYAPDTSEPDSQPYDYRVVNVDRRTGARSNPSNVMYQADGKTVAGLDVLRGQIDIQPAAYGDGNIYQEVYRRGGSLTDNWYGPTADNKDTGDGSLIHDTLSDIAALTAGAVEIDHDQPVTTSDAAGNAVYGEPLGFLIGPIDETLFGGGDQYRPGDIYWCKAGQPDHWPAANHKTVCPPSETLLNGGMYGGQGFVFSRERLYSIQAYGGNISVNPTDCAQGLVGRWAMAIGPGGIFFVARDAVRVTQGGHSTTISDLIRPLFRGETVNGYFPIDFSQPDTIRLAVHGDQVWFGYTDTQGNRVWWVYSLIFKTWQAQIFAAAAPVQMVYSDPELTGGLRLVCGAGSGGKGWVLAGAADDGTDFAVHVRTGALLAGSREEKLFGDVVVYGDLQGSALTAQTLLNVDQLTNAAEIGGGSAGYREYLYQPFGLQPQHAAAIGLDLVWGSNAPNPATVTQIGLAVLPQPEITMKRATAWQPLNGSGEAYVYACWIDCDTFGAPIVVVVEGLRSGAAVTLATLTITSSAGRRLWFDWPAHNVDMVRLRPTTDCGAWMLFGQGWLTRPEPPLLPGMDSGFINLGDTYHTGLDLEIDTLGVAKQIIVTVDQQVLHDPATTLPYWTVTAAGRSYVHLTLPWGRGHIYRFYSTDGVPVLVYTHKWQVEGEPAEQTNWNQNFTIAGTLADKWIKGILLECDTFGETKLVNVEVDHVPVPGGPFPVTTNDRAVVQIAFPQVLGRVFRIWPADNFPGRLYSVGWLFDQEPYCLTRFETQEITFGIDDWKLAVYGQITYKGLADITMTVQVYGQDAQLIASDDYVLPASATKAMRPLKPLARKGTLYKYIFTSDQGFWLYREESHVLFQPWQGGPQDRVKPFGNDDLDSSRGMMNAVGAASRSNAGDAGLEVVNP